MDERWEREGCLEDFDEVLSLFSVVRVQLKVRVNA
jgi:hypothetical protein